MRVRGVSILPGGESGRGGTPRGPPCIKCRQRGGEEEAEKDMRVKKEQAEPRFSQALAKQLWWSVGGPQTPS